MGPPAMALGRLAPADGGKDVNTGGPVISRCARSVTFCLPVLCLPRVCTGLTKSILNEHVPVDQRARWNLFAVLSATGWSGTAFLGGVLADKIGYRRTFCITLGFHAASCACLLPLLWLVPRAAHHRRSAARRAGRVPLASTDAMGEPNGGGGGGNGGNGIMAHVVVMPGSGNEEPYRIREVN